jgi:hypothetical protein
MAQSVPVGFEGVEGLVTLRAPILSTENRFVRLFEVPEARAISSYLFRKIMASCTRIAGKNTWNIVCRKRTQFSVLRSTRIGGSASSGDASHQNSGSEECAFQRCFSIDPGKPCDFANRKEAGDRSSKATQHTALKIHSDPAHCLPRDWKKLDSIKRRLLDTMGLGRSGRAKGVKISVIALRYQAIVAMNCFDEILRRNSRLLTELIKTVSLDCHPGCLKDQFVDVLLVFPACEGYGKAVDGI